MFGAMATIPRLRPAHCVGGLLDMPTGKFQKGRFGENILSSGFGNVMTYVGGGNTGKSLFCIYMHMVLANLLPDYKIAVFDSEVSMEYTRLESLAKRFAGLTARDIEDIFKIVSQAEMYGDKWFDQIKALVVEKMKDKKDVLTTPFLDPKVDDGKTLLKARRPNGLMIDSLSELLTSDIQTKMVDGNGIGAKENNTMYARGSLAKKQLVQQLPVITERANLNLNMVVQFGNELDMGGMFAAKPGKLTGTKAGSKYVGGTKAIEYINNGLWEIHNHKPLVNKTYPPTGVLYPGCDEDREPECKDLVINTMKLVRSKMGPSNIVIDMIWSQREGVLPHLSQFHYLKEKKFGISGSNTSYHLDLYPEVSLSRTTVRSKIDEDPKLRRALELTAYLCQGKALGTAGMNPELICTPAELYEDIKKAGYDWDVLLGESTGQWTYIEYDDKPKYLSILDLLEMRADIYKPYWYPKAA